MSVRNYKKGLSKEESGTLYSSPSLDQSAIPLLTKVKIEKLVRKNISILILFFVFDRTDKNLFRLIVSLGT